MLGFVLRDWGRIFHGMDLSNFHCIPQMTYGSMMFLQLHFYLPKPFFVCPVQDFFELSLVQDLGECSIIPIHSSVLRNISVPFSIEEGYHQITAELVDFQGQSTHHHVTKVIFAVGEQEGHEEKFQKNWFEKQAEYQSKEEFKNYERTAISQAYKPKQLHPEIFELNENIFSPHFLAAIKNKNPEIIFSLLKKESPYSELYTFDLFTPEFCQKLIEEVEHFQSMDGIIKVNRPNSMNNYGAILEEMGFSPMLDELLRNYLRPLVVVAFPDWETENLDSHHSFVVEYKIGKDLNLERHMDESTITLNICLGKEFQGGTVYFKGMRGHESEKTENVEVQHNVGRAILHVGQHYHGANNIESGHRFNLILWLRSKLFWNSMTERFLEKCGGTTQSQGEEVGKCEF